TLTGLIDWLGRIIPRIVVRGIQLGLGLQLTTLALKDYVPRDGAKGFVLAAIAFVASLFLLQNRKYPAALFVIFIGLIYALIFKLNLSSATENVGFNLPKIHAPDFKNIWAGFILLALPQVPLSIGNSILAAKQTAHDLFPERPLSLRKISFTYSIMNLVNPFFGGIPTCHGSGGLAGHYAFGARTGGSVIIYGILYLTLGFFFSGGFENIIQIFPLPVLGVILLFEGIALMLLIRDAADSKENFFLVLLVGLIASGLPYGYLIALIVGTILVYALPGFRSE
ncbi:MAG: putative sulfate/molybdate transporter, partial [Verrucomicrobiota bacterium]|nr:putative sulfate/molybdate transporter [Verrucomicrobiota bacterium]